MKLIKTKNFKINCNSTNVKDVDKYRNNKEKLTANSTIIV